jgi:hypothetical protein
MTGTVRIDMQLRAFWRSVQYGHRWNRGRVLLTGVTGYLGGFLLKDLDLLLLTNVRSYRFEKVYRLYTRSTKKYEYWRNGKIVFY